MIQCELPLQAAAPGHSQAQQAADPRQEVSACRHQSLRKERGRNPSVAFLRRPPWEQWLWQALRAPAFSLCSFLDALSHEVYCALILCSGCDCDHLLQGMKFQEVRYKFDMSYPHAVYLPDRKICLHATVSTFWTRFHL